MSAPAIGAGSRRVAYGLLVIAVFAGVIGIGMASGTLQTTGRTASGGGRVAPQGESVAEVKGWMFVGDVAAAWSVPLPELLAAFDLPVDTEPFDRAQGSRERPVLGRGAPRMAGIPRADTPWTSRSPVRGASPLLDVSGQPGESPHEPRRP